MLPLRRPAALRRRKMKAMAGPAHAESDAERMVTESDADVEKQFDKSTGRKRKFAPFHEDRVVGQWATGQQKLSIKSRCS